MDSQMLRSTRYSERSSSWAQHGFTDSTGVGLSSTPSNHQASYDWELLSDASIPSTFRISEIAAWRGL